MNFGEAVEALKAGKRVARTGWNGKGMFVVYQKGYPQGIPCNIQTEEEFMMLQIWSIVKHKWAKTHLGVKKTNYTKQDIKAVNRVNRAMQRIYKEYPQLNGFIDEIRFVDNLGIDAARAAISKKGSEIKTVLKISSSHFADQKVINNLIKSQVEEGN